MTASHLMPVALTPEAMQQPSAALYEQVKAYIRQKSRSGEWKPGDRIPSENDLVRILGIFSRYGERWYRIDPLAFRPQRLAAGVPPRPAEFPTPDPMPPPP